MRSLITLIIVLLSTKAQAEVFHWPKLCSEQILRIENFSNQSETLWLQSWNQFLINETDVHLPGLSQIEIPLKYDLSNSLQNYSLLLLKASEHQLKITSTCSDHSSIFKIPVTSFEGGEIYYKIQNHQDPILHLKNLFPEDNILTIEELNPIEKSVQKIQLKGKDSISVKLNSQKKNRWVKISAEQRFHSAMTHTGARPILSYTRPQRSMASESEKYFLMGPIDNNGDQFVIKINDPVMIAKAYQQINNPNLHKIVFAKIKLGHQGFNRNMIKKEKSFWSWSVTEVTNISDFASTACDGFPQLVEDHALSWTKNLGRICFWSYRIKKELSLKEINQH